MSLINQVLKDIDERRAAEYSENKTDLDDLHFAHLPKRKRKIKPAIVVSVAMLLVVITILGGLYIWQQVEVVDSDSLSASKPDSVSSRAGSEKTVVAQATPPVVTKTKRLAPVPQKKPKIKTPERKRAELKATPLPRAEAEQTSSADFTEESETLIDADPDEPIDDTPARFSRSTVPLRPEQKAELLYQTGYDHLRAQRNRLAEKSLRQALAMESSHVKARELLSGIYIKQGRWVEASELLREGLTYSPEHLTFSKLYARSLMQLNKDVQAIAVLKRNAPQVQSDPNYFAILAALYQRQNQHGEAAEVYARLVSLNPNNGVWWVGLGISLEALGRNQDALQAYGRARKTGNLRNDVARYTDNRLLALDELNFPSEE